MVTFLGILVLFLFITVIYLLNECNTHNDTIHRLYQEKALLEFTIEDYMSDHLGELLGENNE